MSLFLIRDLNHHIQSFLPMCGSKGAQWCMWYLFPTVPQRMNEIERTRKVCFEKVMHRLTSCLEREPIHPELKNAITVLLGTPHPIPIFLAYALKLMDEWVFGGGMWPPPWHRYETPWEAVYTETYHWPPFDYYPWSSQIRCIFPCRSGVFTFCRDGWCRDCSRVQPPTVQVRPSIETTQEEWAQQQEFRYKLETIQRCSWDPTKSCKVQYDNVRCPVCNIRLNQRIFHCSTWNWSFILLHCMEEHQMCCNDAAFVAWVMDGDAVRSDIE